VAEARPLEPAPVRGPIFLIGAMGSGTTLLRLMLDSHQNIALPHETGFMRAYNAMRFIPFKWTGRHWAKRLGWEDDELDAELREFFDRIFMRYASQTGKTRWGEKTPFHTWHISAMKRVFPDAVFVGIVRHPGAAISSNMNRFGHPAKKAVIHYERYNKEIARQAAAHPKRMVILRYEDLILRTEPVMRELIDWLGEPWDPAVLEHHEVQSQRDHMRIEGKTRPEDAIDASRIAKWTERMAASDRALVKRHLGRLPEFFGHSMDDPLALEPFNERDSFLFGGDEVMERVRAFPQLDIETQMPMPIYERLYHPRNFTMIKNPWGGARWVSPEDKEKARTEAVAKVRDRFEEDAAEPTPLKKAARPLVNRLPAPARRGLQRAARRMRARSAS
jgi:sulfotransferase family protein